ncbi:Gfo/Idh/MocA family oxidoreductase [Leifsonia sp. H3M29-4]|uniref:Gfo/Idh/MocA family protein n=1 Tax=Salinibacterium metalliresistens TaxID=3031321 RepID=UPI0023DA5CEF|nr:Gfo/Idh/MocA family oxidoreductase [Salinibacterium metalliresistens]MDF1477848.1 Gfo/Idh/MocA family oxidoreductase [Salinibacterium metalliresistens]
MSSFPTTLPAPTNTPLRGGPVLRWGVLAPGGIANDFVTTLHANTDQRVAAVASRSAERAGAFAAKHGIPTVHVSYEALVGDPGVDVVYIAAPHSEHLALALLTIAAGKHVLIEKPIAVSADQAREIRAAARAAGVFAMEAMWSRFLPQSSVVAQLLADGVLGEIGMVTADFSVKFDFDPTSRAFDPALGGGALLDLGVYATWFSHFVLGAPSAVTARGSLASTGVDEQAVVTLEHPGGALAAVTTSMRAQGPVGASIAGTKGTLVYPTGFPGPAPFELVSLDGDRVAWHESDGFQWRDGLCYQATAVAQYIADGLTESPIHSLDDTIEILEVLDEARRQLGAR